MSKLRRGIISIKKLKLSISKPSREKYNIQFIEIFKYFQDYESIINLHILLNFFIKYLVVAERHIKEIELETN